MDLRTALQRVEAFGLMGEKTHGELHELLHVVGASFEEPVRSSDRFDFFLVFASDGSGGWACVHGHTPTSHFV